MNNALFDYRLRESPRARRVRLRVTLEHGLEVIVPRGYMELSEIHRFMEQKQRWIHAALERAEVNRKYFDPQALWRLPEQIVLPALERVWQVAATATPARGVRVRAVGASRLEISGCIDDERACRAALGRWLVRQAHAYLVPRLQALSQRTGMRYRQVNVRRQRTRWASCSRQKGISLNVKLLFLSPPLADYVLLHELCHTIELNHSKRFWALVERHCPDYRQHDAALRTLWERVPRWAR